MLSSHSPPSAFAIWTYEYIAPANSMTLAHSLRSSYLPSCTVRVSDQYGLPGFLLSGPHVLTSTSVTATLYLPVGMGVKSLASLDSSLSEKSTLSSDAS